jgi:hypothetical protein
MIVDAHAHLGYDGIFDDDFTEADLVESQVRNGIDLTLVQPGTEHDLPGIKRQHDAIADLIARHPGRFRGIANPNPHLPGTAYETEVERCVKELGFVGIKLHPFAHAVNPLGRHGRRVFGLAEALRVPVMVHTGAGIPWAAPSLLAPIADAHPGLRIILAHAGGSMLSGEAGLLAARYSNVFLEPSWVGGFQVRSWVRELGACRVMFGSDHADNAETEMTKFRSAGLSQDELGWALGGTAAAVFALAK